MFDPYHKWLAIPPGQRPPTYYQLLGVSPDEQDPEVMQEAALRQTSHVRMYQIGTHVVECTRLLNEIAQARTTLLNPAKRKEYDARTSRRAAGNPSPGPEVPAPETPSRAVAMPPLGNPPVVENFQERARPASVGIHRGYVIAIGLIAMVGPVLGYLVLIRGRSTDVVEYAIGEPQNAKPAEAPAGTADQKPSPPKSAVQSQPEAKLPPEPPAKHSEGDATGPVRGQKPSSPVDLLKPRPSHDTPEPQPRPPAEKPETPVVQKAPVPNGAAQARAEKQIKELFKAEYARPRPADRLTLAAELLQKAEETDDDMVGRFVLFREAHDLAAGAGDVVAALTVVERIAARYAVAKLDLEVRAVEAALEGARAPAEFRTVAEVALELVEEPLGAEQLEAAGRLLSHAAIAAHKAENAPLLKQVRARAKEVGDYQTQAASAREAADTLEGNPNDAKANLTLGKYLCFWKGSWAEGLPHLARGSDRGLQALAQDDLAEPREPVIQAKLGHDWIQHAAGHHDGRPKVQMARRAQRWYREALPGLSGLSQTHVAKRLREIEDSPSSKAADIPGERHRLTGHTDAVTGVALSKDGRLAVSGSADGTVRLWDVDKGERIRQFGEVPGPVTGVALSPDGKEVAAGTGSGTAVRWNAATAAILNRYETNGAGMVGSVAYSAKGDYLVLGGGKGRLDARPLKGAGASREYSFRPVLGVLRNVAVSPDERWIVFTDSKGKVHLCDWKTKRARTLPYEATVLSVAFAPGGRGLATGAADKTVRLWAPLATTWRPRICLRGHTQAVTSLAFSADGRRILSGSADRSVRLWDAKSGRLLQSFLWHTGKVTSVAISGDGRLGLSGSEDKTVRVWRLPR